MFTPTYPPTVQDAVYTALTVKHRLAPEQANAAIAALKQDEVFGADFLARHDDPAESATPVIIWMMAEAALGFVEDPTAPQGEDQTTAAASHASDKERL